MRLKICYIDDEPGLCQIFEDNFGVSSQVEITTFVSPEAALKSIAVHPPDLVFLDYRLPNTTGIEVARQIDPKIPIALVTGDLSMKMQRPFVKIFLKPFNFKEMEDFISGFIAQKKLIHS